MNDRESLFDPERSLRALEQGSRPEAVEALCECLHLALLDERGLLIAALYALPTTRLEALVEAAQMIDSEGVEILDADPPPDLRCDPDHPSGASPE